LHHRRHPSTQEDLGQEPEDIIKEVKRVVDGHGRKEGLIIATAGEIPFDAPTANIRALAQATAS